jgi:hypothetical protein
MKINKQVCHSEHNEGFVILSKAKDLEATACHSGVKDPSLSLRTTNRYNM